MMEEAKMLNDEFINETQSLQLDDKSRRQTKID
jgi:hypothetical protein